MIRPFLRSTIEAFRDARRVLVLTGAGVSAESGIPTFRGRGGVWEDGGALAYATAGGFERDIEGAWRWFDGMRQAVGQARPNGAHATLAAMEPAYSDFALVTQNVDGLHAAAGSRNVIEVHGNLWRLRCLWDPGHRWEDRACPLRRLPPACPVCGGTGRPDVVLFGEGYGPELGEAIAFAECGVDVALVVGASGAVGTPRCLIQAVREAGAYVVEVNVGASDLSDAADDLVAGKAGEVLPALWAEVRG
jgi:NAD-dependent deacetylase